MASVSAFSISTTISPIRLSTHPSSTFPTCQSGFPFTRVDCQLKNSAISYIFSAVKLNKHASPMPIKVRAVAEEEQALATEEEPSLPSTVSDQTVSVAVSPSDKLTMFFQAEGTMSDSVIPAVTKALEGVEGISDLKVRILEGIASVELSKQTTIQATGVASNLIEVIQGSGFKLQTLNLSFEDEEDFSYGSYSSN